MWKKIKRACIPYQECAQQPHQFKFTLRDYIDFNHRIYTDIFYLDITPILHVVDEATRFLAAQFLAKVSSKALPSALRRCWIYLYLGPPDVIAHDAGKNFMGWVLQANTDMFHITTKSIPVESAHSISIVERYHQPLIRAFNIIRNESPDTAKQDILQMALKAVNDSLGPDGLVSKLLVIGAILRLVLLTDQPTPSTFQRSVALRKPTESMSRHFAGLQFRDAISARNGLRGTDIHNVPIGSRVLVYQPEKEMWDVLYSLLAIAGEDVITLLPPPAIPTKFHSTVIKLFMEEEPHPKAYENRVYTPKLSRKPQTVGPSVHLVLSAINDDKMAIVGFPVSIYLATTLTYG